MKSSGIGGQAVLEGVMMKYKSDYSVAVRKPDGEISVIHGKCTSITEKSLFFRLPVIRGIANFAESLALGMKTLTYSADYYEEEEEEKAKEQTNLADKKSLAEEQENGEKPADDGEQTGRQDKKGSFEVILAVVVAVLLASGIFIVLPLFLSQLLHSIITSHTVLAVIEGIIRIVLFIGYVVAISFMEDIKRVFMYHGAEHKSINCVENGLPLTVENVRGQSKHHRRCGTSFLLIVMFISIICFMFITFENIWLRMVSRILLVPLIAGISYEFIKFAGNTDNKIVAVLSKPGMFLQRLTTREPDDEMIEVAIASIEEIFDWEAYQRHIASIKNRRAGRDKKTERPVRKSRAQLKEELRERERENKLRAEERARKMKEMEEREAELERIAEEARKRKAARRAVPLKTDTHDENLEGLDHFLNTDIPEDSRDYDSIDYDSRDYDSRDYDNKDYSTSNYNDGYNGSVASTKEGIKENNKENRKNVKKENSKGAKIINLSDYK